MSPKSNVVSREISAEDESGSDEDELLVRSKTDLSFGGASCDELRERRRKSLRMLLIACCKSLNALRTVAGAFMIFLCLLGKCSINLDPWVSYSR